MNDIIEKARVLLLNEDYLFSVHVKQLLEQEEDMEIVDECVSAKEALVKINILNPDIVLIGASPPGTREIEACRQLTNKGYEGDILIFGAEQGHIDTALKLGASGYYPKEITQTELVSIIRRTRKWQSIRRNRSSHPPSIHQIEGMILDSIKVNENIGGLYQQAIDKESDYVTETIRAVKLSIALPHTMSQLCRFSTGVEKRLQAKIISEVGSWSGSIMFLKFIQPVLPHSILEIITAMPEVKEANEKDLAQINMACSPKEEKKVSYMELAITLNEESRVSAETQKIQEYVEIPDFSRQMAGNAVG